MGHDRDTASSSCTTKPPPHHARLGQPGLQAGSQHSRFLPGGLGQEESVTASRHPPARHSLQAGSGVGRLRQSHGVKALPGHVSLCRRGSTSAARALALGEWQCCRQPGAPGAPARPGTQKVKVLGDAGAGKEKPGPGPKSQAARAPTAGGQSVPPSTRLCRSRLPLPEEAVQTAPAGMGASKRRGRMMLIRPLETGSSPPAPQGLFLLTHPTVTDSPAAGVAPAGSRAGQARMAEGIDVTTCP